MAIKTQLIQVYEGKVLHPLYCLYQLQIVQVFQNLTRTQHEELQMIKDQNQHQHLALKNGKERWILFGS